MLDGFARFRPVPVRHVAAVARVSTFTTRPEHNEDSAELIVIGSQGCLLPRSFIL